jgi:3'-phosphoadenosine 5'-phosphosulfate (PAPS) 3'-phosphatase
VKENDKMVARGIRAGISRTGSFGLRVMRVAEGKADAAFATPEASIWDVVASHMILNEAGGTAMDKKGKPLSYAWFRTTTVPRLLTFCNARKRQAIATLKKLEKSNIRM